jgi:hypothetical protein
MASLIRRDKRRSSTGVGLTALQNQQRTRAVTGTGGRPRSQDVFTLRPRTRPSQFAQAAGLDAGRLSDAYLGQRNAKSRLRIANRRMGMQAEPSGIPLTFAEKFKRQNAATPWQPMVGGLGADEAREAIAAREQTGIENALRERFLRSRPEGKQAFASQFAKGGDTAAGVDFRKYGAQLQQASDAAAAGNDLLAGQLDPGSAKMLGSPMAVEGPEDEGRQIAFQDYLARRAEEQGRRRHNVEARARGMTPFQLAIEKKTAGGEALSPSDRFAMAAQSGQPELLAPEVQAAEREASSELAYKQLESLDRSDKLSVFGQILASEASSEEAKQMARQGIQQILSGGMGAQGEVGAGGNAQQLAASIPKDTPAEDFEDLLRGRGHTEEEIEDAGLYRYGMRGWNSRERNQASSGPSRRKYRGGPEAITTPPPWRQNYLEGATSTL